MPFGDRLQRVIGRRLSSKLLTGGYANYISHSLRLLTTARSRPLTDVSKARRSANRKRQSTPAKQSRDRQRSLTAALVDLEVPIVSHSTVRLASSTSTG